jgi:hypothetical protein
MKENKYKRRTSTEFKQQTTKFQDEKGTGMGGGGEQDGFCLLIECLTSL